jgi:hypothetical protein
MASKRHEPDAPPDEPRSHDELVAEVSRMRDLEIELIETGVHDPSVRGGRLAIFRNPWAERALPPTFAGPYDDQHGIVDVTVDRITLGQMACGVLSSDVVRAFWFRQRRIRAAGAAADLMLAVQRGTPERRADRPPMAPGRRS